MKKVILAIVFSAVFGVQLYSQQDIIETYFKEYEQSKDFTTVYVSPEMFTIFQESTDMDVEGELAGLFESLNGLKILTSETNGSTFYESAITKVAGTDYKELLSVESEGDKIKFLFKQKPNSKNYEEVVLMVGGNEFLLLSFTGDITMEQIKSLAKEVEKGKFN